MWFYLFIGFYNNLQLIFFQGQIIEKGIDSNSSLLLYKTLEEDFTLCKLKNCQLYEEPLLCNAHFSILGFLSPILM